MSKRILSLVLALVMVLGTFSFAFADEAVSEKVQKLVELGLVKGDEGTGDLRLADPIKRSEVAAMVVRAMDKEDVAEAVESVVTFPDVLTSPADKWANGHINVAYSEGIVNGYPDGTFRPANNITKAEAVSMMVRVLGGLTEEEQKLAVGRNWATIYLAKAKDLGILEGIELGDANETATREFVFELVFNTITTKESGLIIADTVEGIVVENYRTENLDKDDIVVHVMRDQVQRDGKYYEAGDEFRVTINRELKAKGLDVETLLGRVVTISFDKDGKVVDIKEVPGYSYVEGPLTKVNDKEIKLDGKWYTTVKEEGRANYDERLYQVYYNNEDISYNRFADRFSGAEYAKATVRNGKVLFIEAFNFTDVAPVAEDITDKNVVKYYDDYRDGQVRSLTVTDKAYVINYEKDERTDEYKITLGNNKDIEAYDVIHWFTDHKGNLTVFVRAYADNKVEGEYEEAHAAKSNADADIVIVVDGEEYEALIETKNRTPVYSTTMDQDEFLALSKDYDWDLEPFEGEEVVLLRDMFDYVQLIGAEMPDKKFFAVISDLMNYDFELVKNDEAGAKGEGSEYSVSLRGTTFKEHGVTMSGTKEQQLAEFNVKDLVLVTAEEDRIEVLDLRTLESKEIEELNKDVIDFGGDDWYYLSKNVVIFDVVGAPKATTVKKVNDDYFWDGAGPVKGYAVTNDRGIVVAIVITDGELKGSELGDGYIVKVNRVRMRSDRYYLTVETANGDKTTHLVAKGDAHNLVADRDTLVKAGALLEIKFIKGQKIEDEPTIQAIEVIYPGLETYEIVKLERIDSKGERKVVLKDKNGVEGVRWISRNAHVFGDLEVEDVVAVREMDKYDRLDIVYVVAEDVTGEFVKPVDKSKLEAKIAEAEALNADDYTEETWEVFAKALEEAQAVFSDTEATQEEVDAALKALEEAIKGLEEKPETPAPELEIEAELVDALVVRIVKGTLSYTGVADFDFAGYKVEAKGVKVEVNADGTFEIQVDRNALDTIVGIDVNVYNADGELLGTYNVK